MRTCGPWDCGPETSRLAGCRACWIPSKAITAPASKGEEGRVSGGVFDQSTHAEDGPGTGEALASPRRIPVWRRAGDPSPTHDASAGARVVGL
jgi:hypothetical protein